MNDLTKPILEEIKDLITEGEFNARWGLIETYHQVGVLIVNNNLEDSLQDLAQYVGRSPRMIYYCLALVNRFPELTLLPEGKNISMNKIITKYLTKPEEKEEHIHDYKLRCYCGAIK